MEFKGTLMSFQSQVVDWCCQRTKGIIGLDMGLGKTVLSIANICRFKYGKTLIVCPSPIVQQWIDQIHKFVGGLSTAYDVVDYTGSRRHKYDMNSAKIVVTTYDIIKLDMINPSSSLVNNITSFDCMILDEAHVCRNPKTRVYKTCKYMAGFIKSVWLLTGTSIQNGFSDFMSLCHIIGIDDAQIIDNVSSVKSDYYIRMTKESVLKDFPKKHIIRYQLTFSPEEQQIYDDIAHNMATEYHDIILDGMKKGDAGIILSKILKLRESCNHPYCVTDFNINEVFTEEILSSQKFEKIYEIINQLPVDEKIIIFSQWSRNLALLNKFLNLLNIESVIYNGDMNRSQKDETLKKFKNTNTRVILMTYASGGVGLDMSYANHVILMDQWWNAPMEEQAINRIYRIGQHKEVYIHILTITNTIESWMSAMKSEKTKVDSQFHHDSNIYHIDSNMLAEILHKYL